MNPELKKSMLEYYDARAAEYDEIYIHGTVPGSNWDSNVFRNEVSVLAGLVATHIRGRILDAPCGGGFWSKFYATHATSITLVDHSESMLTEARRKIVSLGAEKISTFVCGDLVDGPLPAGPFDAALIAFFLGHLTDLQMDEYFAKLRRVLVPHADLLILDSVYSVPRQRYSKVGPRMRTLKDGRQFEIYKRYFEPTDFEGLNQRWGTNFGIVHVGDVYLAAAGKNR